MGSIEITKEDFVGSARKMREWHLGNKRGEGYDCRCVLADKLRNSGHPNASVDGLEFWLTDLQRAEFDKNGVFLMEQFDLLPFDGRRSDERFEARLQQIVSGIEFPVTVTFELVGG